MVAKSVLNRWLGRDRARSLLRPAVLLGFLVVALLASGQPPGNVTSAATGDNAVLFGGDGYVEVPYSPYLSPTSGITIEGWVKRSGAASRVTLVGNGSLDSYWFGFSSSGKLYFSPEGDYLGLVEGNSVVPAARWTHVAVTYDGLTRCYYINGVLDTVTTDWARPLGQASAGQPLRIGYDTDSHYYFLGMVDNVRIWSSVRTGAQIRDGMFQSIGEPARGLLAEWALDGDATDPVGGHDGTLNGAFAAFDNEGAIPRDIRIPQISVTPALDGFCKLGEYSSATRVTVNGTPTWLLHTATDLWVCFDGLGSSAIKLASVYLDAAHTRLDPAQPEHLRLTVNDDDTTGAQVGAGDGVCLWPH